MASTLNNVYTTLLKYTECVMNRHIATPGRLPDLQIRLNLMYELFAT